MWKYRGKKQKLWNNLEKKYGEPVLEEDEWEDGVDGKGSGDDHEDLDEEPAEETQQEQDL